jgi:hypothetical protein
LTRHNFVAGDVIILRGGTYQNSYNGFSAGCNMSGAGDVGGINTVMPLNMSGTSGNPIIIQNYPNETVIIDGSNARWVGAAWSACGTSSYQLGPSVNVGSAYTGQVWMTPTGVNDSGTRLKYAGNGGCGGLAPGTFSFNGNGTALYVRLPNSGNANGSDLRLACQAGDCATYPINDGPNASFITVRKNPAGGAFSVKYGYYSVRIDNGASNLTFDGVDILAAGGRDYGSCVRVYDGNSITFKNGTCRETSGEGMQFYGGGPGGANGGGIQLTNNIIQNWATSYTGFSVADGGGNGNNLGMSYIYKNCSNCQLLNSSARASFASCFELTTSTDAGESVGAIVNGNNFSDCGYINPALGGRTRACMDVQPQRSVSGGAVRNGTYENNTCHNETFGSGSTWPAQFGGGTVFGLNMSDGGYTGMTGTKVLNNSFDYLSGPGLNLLEVSQPVTFRNNAFGGHLGTGGNVCNGNGPCDVMVQTAAHTHSNNAYWGETAGSQVAYVNGGGTFTRSTAVMYEPSAVQMDPMFVSGANLNLQAGSGMINAGTNTDCPSTDLAGTMRPISSRCDVGAFESNGTAPPVQTPLAPSNVRIVKNP